MWLALHHTILTLKFLQKKKLGQTFVYFEKNILVFFSKGPFNIPNSNLGRNCGQNIEDKNKEERFINQTPNG